MTLKIHLLFPPSFFCFEMSKWPAAATPAPAPAPAPAPVPALGSDFPAAIAAWLMTCILAAEPRGGVLGIGRLLTTPIRSWCGKAELIRTEGGVLCCRSRSRADDARVCDTVQPPPCCDVVHHLAATGSTLDQETIRFLFMLQPLILIDVRPRPHPNLPSGTDSTTERL